jgi:hypothetical protein
MCIAISSSPICRPVAERIIVVFKALQCLVPEPRAIVGKLALGALLGEDGFHIAAEANVIEFPGHFLLVPALANQRMPALSAASLAAA